MVFEFKFPDIGEGITKGKVVEWVVKEGDKVKEDQTIAKVETDKALADIPSPKTGTIDKIMVKAGSEVQVGQTLVTIREEGGTVPAPEAKLTEAPKKETKPKDSGTGAVGELESAEKKSNLFDFSKKPTTARAPSPPLGAPSNQKVLALPGTRQLAKQQGFDISQVRGTGSQGQVTKADLTGRTPTSNQIGGGTTFKVQTPSGDIIEIVGNIQSVNITQSGQTFKPQSVSTPEQPEAPDESKEDLPKDSATQPAEKGKAVVSKKRKYDNYGYIDRKPYTSIRKVIGENMRKSVDTAAHVTAMDEIDVTELWNLRETESKKAKKKGVNLTFLPYITRACITALKKVPSMNASLDEENEEIILKKYYNIGYGVATENGLMVVVVKRAEHKTLYLIGKEVHELAAKARERKIDILDIKGSSFTITNYGSIGGSYGTPIINPGESAILGTGRIRPVPAVIGKNKLGIRYLLPVSLTFDHRVTDGAEAATFLQTLKEELENPKNLEDKPFLKGLKEEEKFDIE